MNLTSSQAMELAKQAKERFEKQHQKKNNETISTSLPNNLPNNLVNSSINSSVSNLLFLGTQEDLPYSAHLKQLVGITKVFTRYTEPSTLMELVFYCKERNISAIFTTSTTVLIKLLATLSDVTARPSIDNYAGSMFKFKELEFLIIHPLKNFVTVPYQKFLTRRFLTKLINSGDWHVPPKFNFTIVTASNFDDCFARLSDAFLIAVDIETKQEHLTIDCIGYSAAILDNMGKMHILSYVIPLDSMYAVSMMRKINWETHAPKVLQNGKYDHLYLARWSAPCYNWLFDTVTMFHCWYCELPKDLGFISAFFVRFTQYWKDLAKTSDKYEYYKYNALDTYGTILVCIEWLLQAPQWAKKNYLMEFPVNFPAHMCELTGIKRDEIRRSRAEKIVSSAIDSDNVALSKMVGTYPNIFNVNSAPQNKALRTVLGAKHIDSSDEKSLKKIGALHPLNKKITDKILDIRGNRKLVSTYLGAGKELDGRVLYALNAHGTDSGRLASRESSFWCGLQIQNIPRGRDVKQTLIADKGFRLAECDSSKAETWDTAYLSGDKNLIAAVNSIQDFHSVNASAFFGVPYNEIYDDARGKTIDKALRDLAKRVNHGANYLMGPSVLLDTMGEDAVWKAKKVLMLPQKWGLLQVTEYLLKKFHETYPSLSQNYYPSVVNTVITTKLLTGAQGWTRYCFGAPDKNKLDKNTYVAHRSQSENAMRLNRAFLKVFYEIALNPQYRNHFKLLAQIHDSILFQFREGHEYLCKMVAERMELEVVVKGADGEVRSYIVPSDIKAGKNGKGAYRWNMTE